MKNGKQKKKSASQKRSNLTSQKRPRKEKNSLKELFGSLKVFRFKPPQGEEGDALPVYAGGPDSINGVYGDG